MKNELTSRSFRTMICIRRGPFSDADEDAVGAETETEGFGVEGEEEEEGRGEGKVCAADVEDMVFWS